MITVLTTAFVTGCLLAAVGFGIWFRRFLPEHHLSSESKDTVKLALGLVATMSALLLGLLVNSAKNSYDTTYSQVMQVASKYALMDRMLKIYGPQATEVRSELHSLIEASIPRIWPDNTDIQTPSKANAPIGDAFYVTLLKLNTRDDTEHTLKTQAISLMVEIAQIRSLMQAESTKSISKPMLLVMVFWLVLIFFGFSLIAPANATANLAMIGSALCAAAAIYLILELNHPFSGLMRISSEPMLNVLSQYR